MDSPDSDFDGLPDAKEDKDRNGKRGPDETDAASADTDGDGMLDGNLGAALNGTYPAEDLNNDGTLQWNESNPLAYDSDADGVNDLNEYQYTLACSPSACGYGRPAKPVFLADASRARPRSRAPQTNEFVAAKRDGRSPFLCGASG